MEYLLIAFLILCTAALILHAYAKKLRRRLIERILERCLLAKLPAGAWYSGAAARQAAAQLNRMAKPQLQKLLRQFCAGHPTALLRRLTPETAAALRLMNGYGGKPTDALTRAELALLDFETTAAAKFISGFEPKTKTEHARLNHIAAQLALNEGDMLEASTKAAAAAAQFRKLRLPFEEATAYLLGGTVYRACGIEDTAQFLLRAAGKIFAAIGAPAKQAESLVNLGMLMVLGSRFDEAKDYFAQAGELFAKAGDETGGAAVLNQQALTALIEGKYADAQKSERRAQKIFARLKDIRGLALCHDLAAQTAAAMTNWKTAAAQARKAQPLYRQSQNTAALFEAELLEAQALTELGQTQAAEKILRRILAEAQNCKTCFHIANVYSLLGLIYLRRGDNRRAEGLFQQSLGAELHNERWSGAAIDSANIALTAQRRGNSEQADKYRELARQYAEESGLESLKQLLTRKLN